MAQLGNFDASKVDPSQSFTPIPAGRYVCAMTKSETKKNKAGTGEFLECTFTVRGGEYSGKTVIDRLNLAHPNATTVEIAKRTLSAICHAVGVMVPRDSIALHNIPLMLEISVTDADEKGRVYNQVDGYSAISHEAPAATEPAKSEAKPAWLS